MASDWSAAVQVLLRLTHADMGTLETLARKHRTTETRVLQHAIVLEKFVDEVLAQGGTFVVQSADKSYHRVLNIQEGMADHGSSASPPSAQPAQPSVGPMGPASSSSPVN